MEFENQNELEAKVEQATGVVHRRVDEDEPKEPEQAALPKEAPADEPEEMFDLLGEPVNEEPKKPAKKESKPKPAPKKVAPKLPEKYGTDFRVAYARYTEILPKEDMTLDEVREWMEVDFPELSKERTKMDVDVETKTIVPMVVGAKKG